MTDKKRLFTWIGAFALALSTGTTACGGDDGGGGGDGGSSSQSCTHEYQCTNGACECKTSGKSGTSCCDPDDCGEDNSNNCEKVCEVCS